MNTTGNPYAERTAQADAWEDGLLEGGAANPCQLTPVKYAKKPDQEEAWQRGFTVGYANRRVGK